MLRQLHHHLNDPCTYNVDSLFGRCTWPNAETSNTNALVALNIHPAHPIMIVWVFFFNKSNMFKLSMFKLSPLFSRALPLCLSGWFFFLNISYMFKLSLLPSRALTLWLYLQKSCNRLSTSFSISIITAIYKRHP